MKIIKNTKQWLKEYSYPISVYFASRFILFLIAYLSLIFIPLRVGEGLWRAFPDNLILDGWSRWDSGFYVDIAATGYAYNFDQPNLLYNVAFFPLYPFLIRAVNTLTHNFHLAAILIANAAFLLTNVIFYKLILGNYSKRIAEKSVLLLAFSPFSLFFAAAYTESIFLMSVLLVFYFGERKKWFWGACFAAAAGATRVVGFLSAVPLLIYYLQSIHFQWRNIRWNILWLGISITGPLSYMGYLYYRFGDPLLFMKAVNIQGWGKGVGLGSALKTFGIFLEKIFTSGAAIKSGEIFHTYMHEVHLLSLIISIVILLFAYRSIKPVYLIWAVLHIVASFTMWTSFGRYLIVIFPLYLASAMFFKERLFELVLVTSSLLLGLFTIMFTHWYWVA